MVLEHADSSEQVIEGYMLKNIGLGLSLLPLLATASACSITARSGPSSQAVVKADTNPSLKGITVVDLDRNAIARLAKINAVATFSETLGNASPVGTIVQPGDVLEISIWEAPPAALFGAGGMASKTSQDSILPDVSTTATLPELLVGLSGTIFVPFAGTVPVAGRSLREIEVDITNRLRGKAHLPQVIVRMTRNVASNVTIAGEVSHSTRMALTPKGERLLDAIAQAGGTTQSVNRITIQVSRAGQVVSMPLDEVIRDPRQNIVLETGDVVTALYQPYSFTVLGAAGRNEEIRLESVGITLAQALGRIGGLQADRANAKGLFIFRWEKAGNLASMDATSTNDRIPVIYRIDMSNPATFFLAQQFEMRDGDIVYVSTAPIAQFQQFVNIIASTVLPLVAVKNSVQP